MSAANVSSNATSNATSNAVDWAVVCTHGGIGYGVFLAFGCIAIIVYNIWNYRKMTEEREPEDDLFARLSDAKQLRGSMQSWGDSSYVLPDARRQSNLTASEGVESAVDLRSRRRESGQTSSTSEEEGGDMAKERYSWRKGSNPTALDPPHGGRAGRQIPSLKPRDSWEV
ncbi:hypothetical protein VM1G_10900 [Cytospora mali]|uniref:Uncharacterized protein n=1 Tax=Cytospora mali TaxID=578113 RepID=A0A194VJJ0_CYTMA|nr:hypothetical protein VM1G_10900 [Valsa mali]